jgi:predicted  nucleic acid-binding Zn-ribbon protein
MSPIGRVFIILNLVLAAVFLAFSAFYLQNHTTYLGQLNTAKNALSAANDKYEQDTSALKTELDSSKNDLQVSNANLKSKGTTLASAEEENTNLKKRLDDLQARIANIEGNTTKMAGTIDNQNTRLSDLTEKWVAATQARDVALKAQNAAVDGQAIAERDLNMSKRRNAALTAEINEKTEANGKLRTEISVIISEIPAARAIAARALPSVSGKVTAVNSSLKTITISLGANQAGVSRGWRFALHNDKTYKGELWITHVADNMAFGRIENVVPGAEIVVGDRASTRLND